MSNVKHFTIEDVTKFVFSKDDNKEINFYRTINNEKCGCLMVQYARHKNINCFRVGSKAFYDEKSEIVACFTNDICYDTFMPHVICTYKQIKVMLKENFPEQTKEFTV